MTTFFVDTSALAKRYLRESGSTWVKSWIHAASGHDIIIAELALVEMFALLARRQREQFLTASSTNRLRSALLWHTQKQYAVIRVNSRVLISARNLVSLHPLRTLDAIQLACALQTVRTLNRGIVFVSGDNNLLQVAAAEGFVTDDPNKHP